MDALLLRLLTGLWVARELPLLLSFHGVRFQLLLSFDQAAFQSSFCSGDVHLLPQLRALGDRPHGQARGPETLVLSSAACCGESRAVRCAFAPGRQTEILSRSVMSLMC